MHSQITFQTSSGILEFAQMTWIDARNLLRNNLSWENDLWLGRVIAEEWGVRGAMPPNT